MIPRIFFLDIFPGVRKINSVLETPLFAKIYEDTKEMSQFITKTSLYTENFTTKKKKNK